MTYLFSKIDGVAISCRSSRDMRFILRECFENNEKEIREHSTSSTLTFKINVYKNHK